MRESRESVLSEIKKSEQTNEIREEVRKGMPERFRDSDLKMELIDENKAPGLDGIEKILDRAAEDTGRAARYYKVRDAIRVYRDNKNPALKTSLLLAVRDSAFNYLLEKKGNAETRKQVCRDIVRAVDSYVQENGIPAERNIDYLTGNEVVPDDVIDLEIQLAGKLTVKASESFEGNLQDRRAAFKRKISDVKLARQISAEIVRNREFATQHINSVKQGHNVYSNAMTPKYDEAVKRLVADYMNLNNVNERMAGGAPEDGDGIENVQEQKKRLGTNMLLRLSAPHNNVELLSQKGNMIEAIFGDILSWNPGDFAFNEPGDFVNRTSQGHSKQEHFLDLYYRLQAAAHSDVLYNEYVHLVRLGAIHPGITHNMIKEAGARISMYREMRDEYVNRLQMMNSPYYALLLQKDTNDYNTPAKLEALTRDKSIASTGKKSIGAVFMRFVKSLVSKNKRLVSGRKTGGEYTRNTDPEKLLKWHRRSIGASTTISRARINAAINSTYSRLEHDNASIREDAARERLVEELRKHNREHEEPIIAIKEEPKAEPIIEVKDEPIIAVKEEPKEEPKEENLFKNELLAKQSAVKDAAAAKTASIDAEMEAKNRARIKAQIEEDKQKEEQERLAREKREQEERERLEREKQEQERLAREKREQEERERVEREKQEQERLAREKREQEERENQNKIIVEDEEEEDEKEEDREEDEDVLEEVNEKAEDIDYEKKYPLLSEEERNLIEKDDLSNYEWRRFARVSEKKKRELLELCKKLDSDTNLQKEMDQAREEHKKEYFGLQKGWMRRNLYDKAFKNMEEDIEKNLAPLNLIARDTIRKFLEKPGKTDDDYNRLYEEIETLNRYRSLLLSNICLKNGERYNLPFFELYNRKNIEQLRKSGVAVSSGIEELEGYLRELDNQDYRNRSLIRDIQDMKDTLDEKDFEVAYKKEGEDRIKLDDKIEEENEDLKKRISDRDKNRSSVDKEAERFNKLSAKEQQEEVDKEVAEYRKMYDERLFPAYKTYFDTFRKYNYFLEKEKKDSNIYRERLVLLDDNLSLIERLMDGEDGRSMAVRRSGGFKENAIVIRIKKEISDLQDMANEEEVYVDYAASKHTGILKKKEKELFDASGLKFNTGEQPKEKTDLINKLIDAGDDLLDKKLKKISAEEKLKELKSVSDMTDEFIKNGLKLEDLTGEQYEELKDKSLIAERKLYTDYISRHRYALNKKTIEINDDPQMVKDRNNVKMPLNADGKTGWLKVSDALKVSNASVLPGFNGNAYLIKSPNVYGEEETAGYMLQNPQYMQVFNNVKQGGVLNNCRGYRGVCGPSHAAHVINQLYRMNITNENINVYLMTDQISNSVSYLPVRDERGKIVKSAGNRINVKHCGGADVDEVSALYDLFNIKHEVHKRDPEKTGKETAHVNKQGIDLDIVHMAEELDRGNVISVTVNSYLMDTNSKDPRDDKGFFDKGSVKRHKADWISGQIRTNHWICLCAAVYDEADWTDIKDSATEKKEKRLKGFMIKDTGSGAMGYVPWERLQNGYRGIYGGGKDYTSDISVRNSGYIVCHQPDYDKELAEEIQKHRDLALENYKKELEIEEENRQEDERRRKKREEERRKAEERRKKEEEEKRKKEEEEKRKKEEEEKQKKIAAYMDGIRNAVNNAPDMETIGPFFEKALKEFDIDNEEWVENVDVQRNKLITQKKAFSKALDGQKNQYQELKNALKDDPEYIELSKKAQLWMDEYDKNDRVLYTRFSTEYKPAIRFIEEQKIDDVQKEINEETVGRYLNEFLEATGKYVSGEDDTYDANKWIIGYMEMYEKYYSWGMKFKVAREKRFKTGIRTRAVNENVTYKKMSAFGSKGIVRLYQKTFNDIYKLIENCPAEVSGPVNKAFEDHKNDVARIHATWAAKANEMRKEASGKGVDKK